MEVQNPVTSSDAFTINTTYHNSGGKLFSAYNLINKVDVVVPWCIFILHNDCEYATPDSEKFHSSFGKFLGDILVGGSQPDFSERTKAFEAYSDVDKTMVFFIENWEPKSGIKIVGTPAREFCSTTNEVQLKAYWTNSKQSFEIDVERYRKQLKKKLTPKPNRR